MLHRVVGRGGQAALWRRWMRYRIALVGLLALGVAGCVTETRTVIAADGVCATYGFKVSSPEYRLFRDRETDVRPAGRDSPTPPPQHNIHTHLPPSPTTCL